MTKQVNILWTGREYYSLENCLIDITATGADISSAIVGRYHTMLYRVEYRIKTNRNWETTFVEVKSQHSNSKEVLRLESDGKGNWFADGKEIHQFKGCIDIDIPLTPFTNTLPINRLKLSQGAEQDIQVIYLDLLEQKILPVRQRYRRLSATKYHYESVPNDFEADIQVDDLGLVIDYPSLFERTAALESFYR